MLSGVSAPSVAPCAPFCGAGVFLPVCAALAVRVVCKLIRRSARLKAEVAERLKLCFLTENRNIEFLAFPDCNDLHFKRKKESGFSAEGLFLQLYEEEIL